MILKKFGDQERRRHAEPRQRSNTFSPFGEVAAEETWIVSSLQSFNARKATGNAPKKAFILSGNTITDGDWQTMKSELHQFAELRYLTMDQCGELADRWLKDLPKQVEHLKIKDCDLTEPSLVIAGQLPRGLKTLSISGTRNFSSLEGLPPKLEYLDLGWCNYNDADIRNLPATLKTLILDHCPVTTEGLKTALAKLSCIRTVQIEGCSINIEEIRPALSPDTNIQGQPLRADFGGPETASGSGVLSQTEFDTQFANFGIS